MTTPRRRFFWGRSLPQALSRAARYHGVAPEQLDYRLRDKRHGFVKHPRAVIVEVDPEHPARAAEAPTARERPAPTPSAPSPPSTPPPPRPAREADPARPRQEAEDEGWEAPDDESELAASEAVQRLIALSGLELTAAVTRRADALELRLDGADRERLAAAGVELLDALETLLPRAVVALAGRRVRCRVDGAGLRAAREQELRELAAAAAERAREQGEALLPPLSPAERRQVHLALRDVPGLATESVGRGLHKRVRVYAVGSE
ncbi:MAG TPA: R3H domain-containing nucleic acid-binding protein [Thermoanaerobaculia bacterium]|jgi:spoIIIJ-associated protein